MAVTRKPNSWMLSNCLQVAVAFAVAAMTCVPWPSQARAQDAVFDITKLDGTQLRSTIASIDKSGVVSGSQIQSPLLLQEIVALDRPGGAAVKANRNDALVKIRLVNGGYVFCNSVTVDNDKVTGESDAQILRRLPLEVVQAIIFRDSETVNGAIADRSADKDTVVVQTEDGLKMVSGIFEGIANQKVGLNFNGKSRKIGLGRTTAVVLANIEPGAAEGTIAVVNLLDGSKVTGTVAGLKDGKLDLQLSASTLVSIPVETVGRVEVLTDNLVYLSSLQPLSVEQKTIFAFQRTWQIDRSIEGNPIRLAFHRSGGNRAVKQYAKGLGTQSWSRIEFVNEKNYTRFQATVGVDAETLGRGDCIAEVVSDGIVLWSEQISGKSDPREVDIDITAMESIELVVKPGEAFDLGDHLDWANARFVKTK